MADISKVKLPNNDEIYDIKDSVARDGIGNAKLFYGTCSTAAATTEKAVDCPEFGAEDLVAGTMINVKFSATNSGAVASLTLNVNGTGAKRIKYIYNNALNDLPGASYLVANYMYTFRYDGTYWVVQLHYNSDTNYTLRDYYYRPYAGSDIYRYKLCLLGENNRLYPIVTTNQTSTTQVAKAVQTVGLRPGNIWSYYSTTTTSAGSVVPGQVLYQWHYAGLCEYNFNASIPAYSMVYLRGTYNKDKDLFYLYDDGASATTSYYTTVPNNTATITLSNYFVTGYYYMLVGGSYSSANYMSLFGNHPLYYFDGINLIPVSTKVAKDEITSMVGTDEQEDNDPYSFRKTANDKISGSPIAAYDEIVGGSIVWNQLIPTENRNFVSTNDDTREYVQLAVRSYLPPYVPMMQSVAISTIGRYDFLLTLQASTFGKGLYITHNGIARNIAFYVGEDTELVYGHRYLLSMNFTGVDPTTVGGVKAEDIQFIDLTSAVTPTIADYIYSLEQTTTGAGVAWLKKYYPEVYYGFTEPHFEHVQVSAKNTVGFNQWDEEWEVGGYANTTGEPWTTSDRIRSKPTNYIPVFGGQTYFSKCSVAINYYFYDESKTFISYAVVNGGSTFSVPNNAKYARFFINTTYGTTYNHDICINLSGDRNGEYEPYKKRTYPLDSSLTLRGIPMLDSANRMYFDGDVYRHDGSGTYWYDVVDMGTLNWKYSSQYDVFYATTDYGRSENTTSTYPMIMCEKYPTYKWTDSGANGTRDKFVTGYHGDAWYTDVRDKSFNGDATTFKAAMSGVMLLFKKRTPTNFTAEPYQYPMSCDSYGTEEFVDYGVEQGTRDIAIPVGHNTKYRSGVYGEIGLKADISYVNTAIGGINSFDVEVVQALPTSNIKDHTIYFVRKTGSTNDVYDEYMYINSAWEHIGSTDIDLSGYVPTTRTINSKALSSNITLSASDVGAAKAESVVSSTLTVASWSNGVYSFTSTYPNASYDIAIEPDGNTITDEQYQAWCEANIVGSSAGNVIKALGTVPTVAIPVVIRVMPK